ncbi:hypothetical protein ES703_12005 [subsurface metagenome]
MAGDITIKVIESEPIQVTIAGGVTPLQLGGMSFHFQDVRASIDDYIHAAIAGTGAELEITSGITNPDVARNASITTTNNNSPSGNVNIEGVNAKGESTEENIATIAGGIAYGNVAWATINKITLPVGVSSSDNVKVGISDKLGLGLAIVNASNIIKKKVDDMDKSSEIPGNVDLTYDTINCATIVLHDDITIWTKHRHV